MTVSEPISAVVNPSHVRAHKRRLHPYLYASELGQHAKMVVTSLSERSEDCLGDMPETI